MFGGFSGACLRLEMNDKPPQSTNPTSDPMRGIKVDDHDRDSLAVLPFAILPFDSVTLRGMNMIKNADFESMIQLYRDDRLGSGQIAPGSIKDRVGMITSKDAEIIHKVATLNSFDVYSLRIALRQQGINVNDTKYLKLSEAKQKELEVYVRPFTNKLVRAIYGDDAADGTTDVSQLFRDADPAKAREKLKHIANKISVDLIEVPQFLEDYGDIYLSISFYRNRLDELSPLIDEFLWSMRMLSTDPHFKARPEIKSTAEKLSEKTEKMRVVLSDRFKMFKQQSDEMWKDMNAERFGVFKRMVEGNHAAIGGLLCKLGVKMEAWNDEFPSRHTAGVSRMADFLYNEMRPGF